MALVTVDDLAQWLLLSGVELTPADTPKAQLVIDAASIVVQDAAAQPTWDLETTPARAKLITVQLAKRTYLNPDATSRTGVGPLSESTIEDFARTLELTPTERADLAAMAPGVSASSGSLWTQPIEVRPSARPLDVYVADSSGSDWMIPYLHPDDAYAMTPLP